MFSLKNHIIPKGSQTLSFGFEKQRARPKEELIFTLIYVLLSSLLALSKVAIRFFLEKERPAACPSAKQLHYWHGMMGSHLTFIEHLLM